MSKLIALNVKCPHCDASLMDRNNRVNDMPSIKLNLKSNGKEGVIRLCSVYGCTEHKGDMVFNENDLVDFYCPHCNEILNSNITCKDCGGDMVKFNCEIGGVVSICSRSGCDNRYAMFEDIEDAMRRFHREYGV
ncbi:MAG: hypothetical protein K8R41_05200 [Bacteroidales bacterium]|nr:hypothetical protein [Bacteroidales bacterium]